MIRLRSLSRRHARRWIVGVENFAPYCAMMSLVPATAAVASTTVFNQDCSPASQRMAETPGLWNRLRSRLAHSGSPACPRADYSLVCVLDGVRRAYHSTTEVLIDWP